MDTPQLVVRPATYEDIPYLQAKLKTETPTWEQVDLTKGIVYVVEYRGEIAGFTHARLVFQIEPVRLFNRFSRRAPRHARAKATLLLTRAIDAWIGDRPRNTTGIYSYFCHILNRNRI